MAGMVDLALSPEERKEEYPVAVPSPSEASGPRYPWGMCIRMDDDTLEKLGLAQKLGSQFRERRDGACVGRASRGVVGIEVQGNIGQRLPHR